MKNKHKIFSCFVSGPTLNFNDGIEEEKQAEEKNAFFRNYVWGENGIDELLEEFDYRNYGKDLELILLQFYLNPNMYELEDIRDIEGYRKGEKSVAMSFIITNENFFNQDHRIRISFLISSIIKKLNKLKEDLARKKLDTRIDILLDELIRKSREFNIMLD